MSEKLIVHYEMLWNYTIVVDVANSLEFWDCHEWTDTEANRSVCTGEIHTLFGFFWVLEDLTHPHVISGCRGNPLEFHGLAARNWPRQSSHYWTQLDECQEGAHSVTQSIRSDMKPRCSMVHHRTPHEKCHKKCRKRGGLRILIVDKLTMII